LAPFPTDWSDVAASGSKLMRVAVASEMLVAYCAFGALMYGLARRRVPNVSLWVAASFAALLVILLYTLAVPNVGSLYRVRLPAWHLILALGLCATPIILP